MDTNFQTSFIPKKSVVEESPSRHRVVGISTVIGVIIFIGAVVSAGIVYGYKVVLEKQKEQKTAQLERARDAFEPELILELQNTDKRLNAANEILSKHITVTPIFEALRDSTMKKVRFTKFDYSVDDTNSSIGVKMSGTARDYDTIAIQADLFAKNKYIQDIVFSNLNLDEKSFVNFDLVFDIDKNLLLYEESQKRASGSLSENI